MFLWFTTGCLTCYLNVFILKLDVSILSVHSWIKSTSLCNCVCFFFNQNVIYNLKTDHTHAEMTHVKKSAASYIVQFDLAGSVIAYYI